MSNTKESITQFFGSRFFLLLIVLGCIILVLSFFFGDSGLFEIFKVRGEISELRQDIDRLKKEKQALIDEIEELKKNPLAYEKKAREELWLMKKNEKVVVIIRDKDKNKKERDK